MGKAIATTFVVLSMLAKTGACARGPLPDPAFSRIEKDSTLTHAVLILENPGKEPVPVVLARPGFLREFVLPPKGAMRHLVPAGPLEIRHGERKIRVNILEKTQNTLVLRI